MKERTTRNALPPDLYTATLAVAEAYQGELGTMAYRWFEAINTHLFGGALPWPLILWNLTPHGGCLGFTHAGTHPPFIQLHPSLLRGSEKSNPWGVPPSWLGPRYALDTLIHECIHVAQHYVHAWSPTNKSETSHNNAVWIAEVNRLAPLLGFAELHAGRSVAQRTGKTVARGTDGNIPYQAVTRFPRSIRELRDTADAYYTSRTARPFPGIEV